MKFVSKKDVWLSIVLWLPLAVSTAMVLYALKEGIDGTFSEVLLFFLGLVMPLFVGWMWFSTYYLLGEQELVIHSGPFRKTIPLQSIRSAAKTTSPLSSYALSLQRIELKFDRYDMVLISPKDRDFFIDQLLVRNPGIVRK